MTSSDDSDNSDNDSIENKQCKACGKSLPLKNFRRLKNKQNEYKYYANNCKHCEKYGIHKYKLINEKNVTYKTHCKLNQIRFNEIIKEDEPIVFSLLASSRSGKTTLLYHIIEKIIDYYDVILFFSSNSRSKIYQNFKSKKILMINGFDDRIVYAMHHLNQESNNRFNFLVVMDDIIDIKHTQVVNNLFSIYRNANFSTVHSVQYMKYMAKDARAQCHKILLGNQNNIEEIKETCETFLYGFQELMDCIPQELHTKSEKMAWIISWYQYNTQDYKFIVVDNLNKKLSYIKSPSTI